MKSASCKPQPKRKYFKSRGFSRLFCFSWEQRKFFELYERVSRKNDLTYGRNDIISVANMYFKPDSYITDDSYLLTYNIFELGDIAFEGNKSKNYAHGRFVENTIGNGIVSHVFDVFKPIMNPYDLLFWKYAINNERLMGSVLLRSTKASTMMTNLVATDFLQESFLVPTYPEQQKIGAFFSQLDNLITLHQRDSIMRFFGAWDNANAWEQRKLGDVVQITMRQSPDGTTYSDEPSDYILVQGNADLQNGWVCPRIWTTQITKKADAGDLIMSVRAPAGAMGKTAYNAVIGRGVAAIKGNEFIYQLLVKMDMDGFWKTLSCGSTFESLNSDNIKNAEVKVPTTAEQVQIGDFFRHLDNLITLHQRERKNRLFGGKNVKQYNFSRLVLQLLRAMDSRLQRRGSSQGDYG